FLAIVSKSSVFMLLLLIDEGLFLSIIACNKFVASLKTLASNLIGWSRFARLSAQRSRRVTDNPATSASRAHLADSLEREPARSDRRSRYACSPRAPGTPTPGAAPLWMCTTSC